MTCEGCKAPRRQLVTQSKQVQGDTPVMLLGEHTGARDVILRCEGIGSIYLTGNQQSGAGLLVTPTDEPLPLPGFNGQLWAVVAPPGTVATVSLAVMVEL